MCNKVNTKSKVKKLVVYFLIAITFLYLTGYLYQSAMITI